MSFNAAGAVEIPLTVFGSLVTEASPINLPEGVSPDNQDVTFLPGAVGGRPGLQKVFNTPFTGVAPVMWAKSYVDLAGQVKNLFLDALGVVWMEDFSNNPGQWSKL